MAIYILSNAINKLNQMKIAKFYVDNWLINKPSQFLNYLKYNLNHKKELCYTLKLYAATAALTTLYERGNALPLIVLYIMILKRLDYTSFILINI